jgi:hypothetical protein
LTSGPRVIDGLGLHLLWQLRADKLKLKSAIEEIEEN